MKQKPTMSLEQMRDIAVDAPNLLIIAADPKTDELFVAYSALAMYGKFEGGVVSRAVSEDGFKAAWQQFSSQLMATVGIEQDKGGKLMNGILDGIQTIGEALSAKPKKHGKRSTKG